MGVGGLGFSVSAAVRRGLPSTMSTKLEMKQKG